MSADLNGRTRVRLAIRPLARTRETGRPGAGPTRRRSHSGATPAAAAVVPAAVCSPVYYFRGAVRPDTLILDRSTMVAVAIERYRYDHADAVPAAVDALVSFYLRTVPTDPLTGEPLRYRATADSYAIYSVGTDGDDDGGENLHTTTGAPEHFDAGADVGIRIMLRD